MFVISHRVIFLFHFSLGLWMSLKYLHIFYHQFMILLNTSHSSTETTVLTYATLIGVKRLLACHCYRAPTKGGVNYVVCLIIIRYLHVPILIFIPGGSKKANVKKIVQAYRS